MPSSDPELYGLVNRFSNVVAHSTGTTPTAIRAALPAVTGQQYVVTDLTFSNSDPSAGVLVTLEDTDGTDLWAVYMAPSAIYTKTFRKPLVVPVGKGFRVVGSGAAASIHVSVSGYIDSRAS